MNTKKYFNLNKGAFMIILMIWLVIGILVGATGSWIIGGRNVVGLRNRIQELDRELIVKNTCIAETQVKLQEQRTGFEEKLAMVNETRELMKSTFQNLATQIMEEKTKALTSQNRENIDTILNPLREQIGDFRRRVDDVYDRESQGRAALANEISNLKSLNLKISEDAINLTKALKGNSKTQGDWGQVILERLLEISGLEKGREFHVQVNSHDMEGNRFFPDTVVHLPQARDVILDSKVSLTDFERYCSSENDEERKSALKNHLLSVKRHINELSEKHYENLEELNSADAVLMFIPTEAAYVVAIKEDPSLFEQAFKKNIILVCPTTLLATLKIIAYSWRLEKQQRNSQEIAQRATDLYDKFCSFLTIFQELGESIKKADTRYEQSLKQLSTGKGNLIKKSQELIALGVKGKKEIPPKLLEQCDRDSSSGEESLSGDKNESLDRGAK
jgi:DNA recombination protein RmuC